MAPAQLESTVTTGGPADKPCRIGVRVPRSLDGNWGTRLLDQSKADPVPNGGLQTVGTLEEKKQYEGQSHHEPGVANQVQ